MRQNTVKHEFVDEIPAELIDGTIYVSIEFETVVHRCCCGCGSKVVTPLSPTDWKLTFDGETVSLDPSVGNWSYPCRSHYFIERSRVVWAPPWSRDQIQAGRARDTASTAAYYGANRSDTEAASTTTPSRAGRFRSWLRGTLGIGD
jgi:hypothetical protein